MSPEGRNPARGLLLTNTLTTMDTIKEIVLQDQKDQAKDDYTTYLQDVMNNGCSSGVVSGLIYYKDTCQFYQDHKEEINELLQETMHETGLTIKELFGDKWNDEDPLCFEVHNTNLLAWFAYEQTVQAVLNEQGIEV